MPWPCLFALILALLSCHRERTNCPVAPWLPERFRQLAIFLCVCDMSVGGSVWIMRSVWVCVWVLRVECRDVCSVQCVVTLEWFGVFRRFFVYRMDGSFPPRHPPQFFSFTTRCLLSVTRPRLALSPCDAARVLRAVFHHYLVAIVSKWVDSIVCATCQPPSVVHALVRGTLPQCAERCGH